MSWVGGGRVLSIVSALTSDLNLRTPAKHGFPACLQGLPWSLGLVIHTSKFESCVRAYRFVMSIPPNVVAGNTDSKAYGVLTRGRRLTWGKKQRKK